jgi:hypothetical protein
VNAISANTHYRLLNHPEISKIKPIFHYSGYDTRGIYGESENCYREIQMEQRILFPKLEENKITDGNW